MNDKGKLEKFLTKQGDSGFSILADALERETGVALSKVPIKGKTIRADLGDPVPSLSDLVDQDITISND